MVSRKKTEASPPQAAEAPSEQAPRLLSDLNPAPYNPREISPRARGGLRRSLVEFGDISGITYNFRTGNLIAGHQRRAELEGLGLGEIAWGEWRDTDLGRERWAEVVVKGGAAFRLRGVDWSAAKEKAANVAANSQAIAGTFTDGLQDLLSELQENADLFGGLLFSDLQFSPFGSHEGPLAETAAEQAPDYTRKIKIPIYEPTGPKPIVAQLTDQTKTTALLARIEASTVPDEIKVFLRAAAERHTVFNFRNIAEYYAHSEADVQQLFEESALVIIDFNSAIANGFAKFTDTMLDLIETERDASNEGADDE